jgi:nucleoside-diphosphate-sugar epimerase
MKYLVTGGAGFIGSHLVERLLQENNDVSVLDGHGNEVTVIDDFSEGKWANLPKSPNLHVYEASILGKIGHLFEDIDIVFHLAALTRPQWSILNPEDTNRVNVDGTLKILRYCEHYKIKRVVFVSSSSIYGQQDVFPTNEKAVLNPMSPYALTKSIGEQYAKLFEKLYGLEVNCIRPFNVYGTRQNPTGGYAAAVPKFIDTVNRLVNIVKNGETPKITGDGRQARDFIYIDDLVDLLILASNSKVFGESFNAGSGKNISINDLYDKICDIIGKRVEPMHIAPVFEPGQTLADITKARELLGWEPKVSLDDGLRKTIEGTI